MLASFTAGGLLGVRVTAKKQKIRGVPRISGTRDREAYWLFRELTVAVGPGDALVMVARDPERTSAALRVWAGLSPLDEGEVVRPTSRLLLVSPIGRWVRELSVQQTIRMLAGIYGLTDDQVEQVVAPAAKTAQVTGILNKPMDEQDKQVRNQIAFAVAVHAPVDVVMFDHTASTGTPEFRPLCASLIAGMRDAGKAVVIATSKPQVALQSGSQAVILRGKRSDNVEVTEAAEFLIRDREKGRRKAQRRFSEDDDDGGVEF